MRSSGTNLRRNIVWGAAKSLGGVGLPNILLAHAKVGDLDVTVLVEEDVVQLEVTVDDAVVVEEEQPYCYLCSVKPAKGIV